MPLTIRLRDVPARFDVPLRAAIENALESGDYVVTVSQSHVDGQWHLQLDGPAQRCRVVLPSWGQLRSSLLTQLLRDLAAVEPGPSPEADQFATRSSHSRST